MNAVFNVSRTFELDAPELFEVLVSRWSEWWGGANVVFEPVVGGRLESGDEVGTVKKIEAPHRLTLELGDTLAILLLQPTPEGSTLQILHSRFQSGVQRDQYGARWEARLVRLASLAD